MSEMSSSVSHSSRFHGGDPADLKIPAAAAWVSVGELRAAEGLGPLELRAMSIWEGFVDIVIVMSGSGFSSAVRDEMVVPQSQY